MKNGLINTVGKDLFLDLVIMPKAIALSGGFLGLPGIRQFTRWFIESLIDDEVFDEAQRLINFARVAKEEGDEGNEAKEATAEIIKLEEQGVKYEDLQTNEEARKAYERYKEAVRNHIRSGRRSSS